MILSPKQIEFYSKISPDALKELAYGSAAVGSGMVPGGGIADYVGALPDPSQKGEYSPSFMENIEKKQYADAALQGLGVFGDMAMASAPVTGGAGIPIGMAAKGLSTFGKIARSKPEDLLKAKETDQPLRLYHGTTKDFEDFDPDFKVKTVGGRDYEGSSMENRGSYYFTPNPENASYYAKSGIDLRTGEPFKSRDPVTGEIMTGAVKGSRVIPVYLKNANYFDVDNPEHLNVFKQSDFYKKNKTQLNEEFDYLGTDFDTLVQSGQELALERITPELKKLGFDGHTTYEGSDKNFAVYDTDLIVSGIEKKADGGEARTSGIGTLHMTARNMFRPMVS